VKAQIASAVATISVICVTCWTDLAEATNVNQSAVISGSVVQWTRDATNINKIAVSNGQVMVNGTQVELAGATYITKTVGTSSANANFCDDTNVAGQGYGQFSGNNLSVYYVYLAQYGTSPNFSYATVITGHAPWSEGYPSSNLTCKVGGNVTSETINQAATFLGSYTVDSNAQMNPFRRTGDEVHFLRAATDLYGCDLSFTTTGTYPLLKSCFLTPTDWPITAVAAIVAIAVQAPAGDDVQWGIVDPTDQNQTSSTYRQIFPSLSNTASICTRSTWCRYENVKIPLDSSGYVYAFDFSKPASGYTDNVNVAYVGYVEVVHHLYY
jgi:hypothetical protein